MKNKYLLFLTLFLLTHGLLSAQKAPDYNNMKYWAAHPWKLDASDTIPEFLKDEIHDTAVDVFFLHPTMFVERFRKAPLNGDIDDEGLNCRTETRTIKFQATIFNAHARVFAPFYRQAHLRAFFEKGTPASNAAFDTAYNDLRKAFQYYLDHYNHGRPIIIAGHSQGAMHGIRLLQEFFDGKPLQKQLVCAYLAGWRVAANDFKHIPLGTSPSQTGCVLTWRTYENGRADAMVKEDAKGSLCVNPITWTTTAEWSDKKLYKGMPDKDMEKKLARSITVKVNDKYNVVWVKGDYEMNTGMGLAARLTFGIGNLHLVDMNLFYLNIRENVKERIDAYMAGRK